ncbi:MAG: disulfide bond formation protein [Gammaproteobacteria bacterium]|jgi:disulfide bond formation protein DsbB|nr:disulfide bond formation protein [Gammaproteobacteria bacterium]
MPYKLSLRMNFLLGFLLCIIALVVALYLQLAKGESPCNLCILQRIAFTFSGLLFLFGAAHYPKGKGSIVYRSLLMMVLLSGLALSLRQIWLQFYPPLSGSCGPDLYTLFKTFPLGQVLKIALQGSDDCAQVHWKFLGLSLAAWTAIDFLILIGLSLVPYKKHKNK